MKTTEQQTERDRRRLGQLHCLRCGFFWWPRVPGRPKACPSCKHRQWDEAKVEKKTA